MLSQQRRCAVSGTRMSAVAPACCQRCPHTASSAHTLPTTPTHLKRCPRAVSTRLQLQQRPQGAGARPNQGAAIGAW
eukprot:356936-Chlamydomonas_euryale.AAC.3